ncbi:ABC transporter ATP-binding protein [Candidatus Leptofilum sp.]|uniref:ABC transporter ATP-binding protein n=1 Tax=Candidatus Leptofilum sp. TaxID=3241576 RepID=UPI003B5B8657
MLQKIKLPLKPYWELLSSYLKPQKKAVLWLAFLLLVSIGLQLANPQIVKYFIDTASEPVESGTAVFQQGLNNLLGAAALFMSVAIVRQAITMAAVYVGENVAWTATNALRADLALHCLRLDMAFHKQHKPGELIERVDGDVNKLANFFSQLFIQLTSNVLLLVGVIVLLWLVDWRVGVSVTAVSLLGVLALNYLRTLTVPRWEALRQTEATLFGFLEEWLTGAETIRTTAAEPYIMQKMLRLGRERWLRMRHAIKVNVFVWNMPLGVFTLAYIAAHIFGTTLFQDGALTIGGIYLIFYYIDVIKEPLWRINRQVEDLQRAAASIRRIMALQAEQPTMHDGPGVNVPAGPLAITFDHLSFFYADDPDTMILQDVNFRLAPGTVLGLLGRTGSGKSTLTKLLFRFYDPTDGAILLGNGRNQFDLRDAKQAELRRHIGLVTQEVQLFHASVRDNLTLFNSRISDGRILEVLDDLGLMPWLDSLPNGLDSPLQGDASLSAGEAQLLAFVRVFLDDPGLVIMDEASSRLDPVTEQKIEQAIDKLLANRTGIIVAHRLATVQRADEILILGNGRIVEYGRRAQLAADPNSQFAQLLVTGLEEAIT